MSTGPTAWRNSHRFWILILGQYVPLLLRAFESMLTLFVPVTVTFCLLVSGGLFGSLTYSGDPVYAKLKYVE